MPPSPQVPEGPFIGRLLSEIARINGSVSDAADEIGVSIQVISSLERGEVPSAEDLQRIYSWLTGRATLTAQEDQDYKHIERASTRRKSKELERRLGGVLAKIPASQPSRSRNVIRSLALLFVGVLAGIAIAYMTILSRGATKTAASDPQPSAARSSEEPASASPAASPTVSTASPTPSATSSSGLGPAPGGTPIPSATQAPWSGPISVPEEIPYYEYKDLSQPPAPFTTQNQAQGDLNVSLNSLSPNLNALQQGPDSSTVVAPWGGQQPPTLAECKQDAQAQGQASQPMLSDGDTFCIETGNGTFASLTLVSVDYNNYFATFDATVWWPSSER
jgi:transcriptional regulator with XRE-family HTH domain